MSCVKVKRKNIPEFYYCDRCKNNGLLSPNAIGVSSGEEGGMPFSHQQNGSGVGTNSSNAVSPDGILYSSTHQNNQNNTNNTITTTTTSKSPVAGAATKPKKPKSLKKSSTESLMMNSSDNIKNNNTNSDSKYLSKKSSNVNGKLKKIRQTTKKVPALTKTNSSSTLAAAALLTALSVNNQVSPGQILSSSNGNAVPLINGIANDNSSNNLLKSPIATNNNNIYNGDVIETQSERTPAPMMVAGIENSSSNNGTASLENSTEKFNNKRLKLL